jgi:hypothetical protein
MEVGDRKQEALNYSQSEIQPMNPALGQLNPLQAHTACYFKIDLNILLPSTSSSPKCFFKFCYEAPKFAIFCGLLWQQYCRL